MKDTSKQTIAFLIVYFLRSTYHELNRIRPLKIITILSPLLLVILTAVYVHLTWRVVQESSEQTRIMIESSRPVQRAYLDIDIDEFTIKGGYFPKKLPIENVDGRVIFKLRNEGRTPAFPVLMIYDVDSLSSTQLNLQDTLKQKKVIMGESTRDFPTTLGAGHEYPFGYAFENRVTNKEGYLYVHFHITYKDIFAGYHTLYSVTPCVLDTIRHGTFVFPSKISTYTLNEPLIAYIDSLLLAQKKVLK